MTSVVLDTNVVVSAHLNKQGMEALVFLLAISGKLRFYISEPVLAEYEEVLERQKFGFKPDLIATALQMIRTHGLIRATRHISGRRGAPVTSRGPWSRTHPGHG